MKNHIAISILFLVFIGCAKQAFPPGGPADKTPPQVIETFPAAGATEVDRNVEILIRFDERIQTRSAPDAIFISPYPGENVKMKLSGSAVKIKFPGPLMPNRTYVITLGTAIQDLRNNALKESFTLAFSTGPVLDTGQIGGQVFTTGKTQGLDVWAYLLGDSAQVDPRRKEPDYIIQCDQLGRFQFTHLAPGRYRVLAIRDRVADRLYQRMEDEIGITFRDAALDSGNGFKTGGLFFRTSMEDTISPRLDRTWSVNVHRIALQFTEPVVFDSTRVDWITFTAAADSLKLLPIDAAYSDTESKRRIFLLTPELENQQTYRIAVEQIADFADNPIDSTGYKTEFTAEIEPDTTRPKLAVMFPEPKSRNVPLESPIRIVFDEPMDTVSTQGIVFSDSSGTPVAGSVIWNRPSEWVFHPQQSLLSLAPYTIRIKPDSVLDRSGNALADTTWRFWTLDEDTLGAIAGTVTDPDSVGRGTIHVSVFPVNKPEDKRTQILDYPGPYEIARLFPGKYRIEAFRDEDGDGHYSLGRLSPFTPAERFTVYPDTVTVRSGWVKEGHDFSLPNP